MDQRALADAALASLNSNHPSDAPWPPVAQRVRTARERLGLSQSELAARLGLRPSEYWDIELHDDEAFTVFPVSGLETLSNILNVPLFELLFGAKMEPTQPRVSYEDVAAGVRALASREKLTVDELSERAGWELAPLLDNPTALGQFNLSGLRDVCELAGVDWFSVLSRSE
jgi:transcriptional regulator with XRE-family HTH domain